MNRRNVFKSFVAGIFALPFIKSSTPKRDLNEDVVNALTKWSGEGYLKVIFDDDHNPQGLIVECKDGSITHKQINSELSGVSIEFKSLPEHMIEMYEYESKAT